jgi:uncharacterized protein (TIGR02147 family)
MEEYSYINLFKDEFIARKNADASYSLRSFAKDLDLTPAYVSLIFSGQRHLSQDTALKISKKLKWNCQKQAYFINLLKFENSKSEESKKVAHKNIQKIESDNVDFTSLNIDKFEVLSVWYYNAILTLLNLKKTKTSVAFIAKRLELDRIQVESALSRLKRLGLAKKDGAGWVALYSYLKIDSIPSGAIKLYHKEMLEKAATAIDEQAFDERDFSNLTITVDRSQLKAAKKKIVDFHHEMAELLGGQEPTEVYQLSVQLFQLTTRSGN